MGGWVVENEASSLSEPGVRSVPLNKRHSRSYLWGRHWGNWGSLVLMREKRPKAPPAHFPMSCQWQNGRQFHNTELYQKQISSVFPWFFVSVLIWFEFSDSSPPPPQFCWFSFEPDECVSAVIPMCLFLFLVMLSRFLHSVPKFTQDYQWSSSPRSGETYVVVDLGEGQGTEYVAWLDVTLISTVCLAWFCDSWAGPFDRYYSPTVLLVTSSSFTWQPRMLGRERAST